MYPSNNGHLTISQARRLSSDMFNNMSKFFPYWELLASLISPNRFSTTAYSHGKGLPSHKRIVKTEPVLAFQIYKSGITNGATPKTRKWFQYVSPNPIMRRVKKVQDYMAHTTEIAEAMLQSSNFYRVMPEANADMGLFSNAAFMMVPDPKFGVWFYPFQMGTFAFQANLRGDVNMFTRRLSMTVTDYVKEFGSLKPNGHIDWANIPTYVRNKWENQQYLDLVYMIQLIIENPFYRDTGAIYHSYQRKFQVYYWIDYLDPSVPPQISNGFREEAAYGADSKDGFNSFAAVRGVDYFPVIVPRWTVPNGQSVGCEGPGETALNSMLVFQQLERDRMLAVEKMLKPPMVAPTSLKRHGASILPGGVTWIEDSAMVNAQFKPAFQIDPKIAELVLNNADLKNAIDDAFYKNIFLMFANQEIKTHVSVAETNERTAEKLAVIAPMLSQYDTDVGAKVLGNLLIIGEQLGVMPPRPRELEGMDINAEYMSILANASKASLMNSFERVNTFASQLAQVTQNPVLLRILKSEDMVKAYADFAGIDPRFISSDEEIKAFAAQLQQQQAAQAEMDMQLKASEVARNMSSGRPAESGSHLETMGAASSF